MCKYFLLPVFLFTALMITFPHEVRAQYKVWNKPIEKGNNDKVAKLIHKGKDVNVEDVNGRTPLMFAAFRGRSKIAQMLIHAGADLAHTNMEGSTALIIAATKGNAGVVEVLINAGASIDARNNIGRTALICAVIYERKKVAKMLIQNGADLKRKDNKGQSAITYARNKRQKNIIKLLTSENEPEKPPLPDTKPAEYTAQRGSGDPLKGLNVASTREPIGVGKYHALIIGIDSYKGTWAPLVNAVNDAKAVEEVLRTRYKMDEITSLYNEAATGENIIKALEHLVETVGESDNVFIFYSGHGEFKKELNKGFWVPVDAESASTFKYISNSDIQTFLGAIKARHTLLIADACFSGDIFRGNTISVPFEESEKYYEKVNRLESRQAITSGGIEPVMDGGKDGHSVFTYYLLRSLKNNESKYFDAGQLFGELKIPVTNNSDQSPQLQPIKNTGDAGGQYIFIRK